MKVFAPSDMVGRSFSGEVLLVRDTTNRKYGNFTVIDMRLNGDGQLVGLVVSNSTKILAEHLVHLLSNGRRVRASIRFAESMTSLPSKLQHKVLDAEWEFEELPRDAASLGRTWAPFMGSEPLTSTAGDGPAGEEGEER